MMSVSQLLKDNESVISMDIFLDGVQKIINNFSNNNIVYSSMVIDDNGYILAHNNVKFVGKNINKVKVFSENELFDKIVNSNDDIEIKNFKNKYYLFINLINKMWKLVLVLDEDELYNSLYNVYSGAGLFLLFVIGLSLFIFIIISSKYQEAEQLTNEIKAIADIYISISRIDLKKGKITNIIRNKKVDNILYESNYNFTQKLILMSEKIASLKFKDIITQFLNLDTLEERLQGMNSISQEFIDNNGCWIRLRFIVIDRDKNNLLHHILLAFESIDEDRKQQEKLKKMSETDMMTGIRNRGSGENEVRLAMAQGNSGMFCLLDIDKFKFINDNFGHIVGDKVIIEIAHILTKTFRNSDIVFRLGGDEFSVFSKGVVDEIQAEKMFKRLFLNVDKILIPELGDYKFNISVGATFYSSFNSDSFEDLYQRADRGAYESKKIAGNHFHIIKNN